MMECIIIEDEPLATTRLSEYISRVPFLKLLHTFDNGMAAIAYLSTQHVDLLFLDIHLQGLNGIEVLEIMKQRPDVILTTAYDQYAIKGFELSVTDYLLKPFSFQRFLEAVVKVEQKRNSEKTGESSAPYIFIKTEHRLEKLFLNDIVFIEGMRDYRRINTASKKVMTLQTFSELENALSGQGFCRVHKSYIVSLNKIEFVERDRIKIGNELIPISDTYKASFYKMIS
jgi:two-component system, LytTR family, response regulator